MQEPQELINNNFFLSSILKSSSLTLFLQMGLIRNILIVPEFDFILDFLHSVNSFTWGEFLTDLESCIIDFPS